MSEPNSPPNALRPSGIVTLLTDFGLEDGYAGVLAGVIAGCAPEARTIDITHKIKPQHLMQAALVLNNCYSYFPEGTVHLCVVDPGVGGKRKPIAVRAGGHLFVGPDNGIFTLIYRSNHSAEAFELDKPEYWRQEVSSTFHGRDLFAPVAARLATGTPIEDVGAPLANPISLRMMAPKETERKIIGKVIYADNFGNLITNIGGRLRERMLNHSNLMVKAGGKAIYGLSTSYDSVSRNELLAIFGSSGFMEVSVNFGSAKRFLQIDVDDSVEVIFK